MKLPNTYKKKGEAYFRSIPLGYSTSDEGFASGWNSAIKEMKRLNK